MKRQDKKQSTIPSVLTIDIGNTTVTIGLFNHDGKLLLQTKFPTHTYRDSSEWFYVFQHWFRNKKISLSRVQTIIVCSVVPKVLLKVESALKMLFNLRLTTDDLRLMIVGHDIKVPIRNCYKRPKQVGQDRLVNAYSGYIQYGAPLIIVDFGTAVTFDVVSKRGEYLGGVITPGLEMACQALNEKTALLPKIQVTSPRKIIGKTTQESIQSGLFYGWGALTDGVVTRLQKETGSAKIILTGGQSKAMSPFVKVGHIVCPDLTLQGLYLLSKQNNHKKIS